MYGEHPIYLGRHNFTAKSHLGLRPQKLVGAHQVNTQEIVFQAKKRKLKYGNRVGRMCLEKDELIQQGKCTALKGPDGSV